jgi:hypothetical protein
MRSTVLALMILLSGCARMFACTTDATYIVRTDGSKEIHYSSCKEQIGLDSDYDPATGRFHVKVDKSSTQESVIAASVQLQSRLVEMMGQLLRQFDRAAAMGAGS